MEVHEDTLNQIAIVCYSKACLKRDFIYYAELLNYRFSLLIRRCFFSFQNNPKNLDPSYKMDLDLWDCLGRVKPVFQQNCIGLI